MSLESNLFHDWSHDELKSINVRMRIEQLICEEITPALTEDTEHLTRMIMLLYENYHGRYEPEDFLKALKEDSFRIVMDKVDEVNLRGLMILHKYLYNYAPGDWRKRRNV